MQMIDRVGRWCRGWTNWGVCKNFFCFFKKRVFVVFRGCCTAVPHKKERRRNHKKRKGEKNTLISQKGQHASIHKSQNT